MRPPVTEDYVDELLWQSSSAGPEEWRANARALQELASSPHPDDEVSRGLLLVQAAEQLEFAGDAAASLELVRQAVQTGDHVIPDVRCYLFSALMAAGSVEEAFAVSEELRRSRPDDLDVFVFMGEAWEASDELNEANRWFTRAVLRAERTEADSHTINILLLGRWRVRKALGYPADEYDERAIAQLGMAMADADDAWDHDDPRAVVPPAGRREPCPCGSGRRYKNCCGRQASGTPAT